MLIFLGVVAICYYNLIFDDNQREKNKKYLSSLSQSTQLEILKICYEQKDVGCVKTIDNFKKNEQIPNS
jgi:hypothetical protein